MHERWPMKVHRSLTGWSRTLDLVPEWMWWAHLLLAGIAAVTLLIKFELPLWGALVAFVAGAVSLTAGLFHPITAWFVALLGGAVCVAMSSIVFGAIFLVGVKHLLEGDAALYLSLGLGAIVGSVVAIASYRPLLTRLYARAREHQ